MFSFLEKKICLKRTVFAGWALLLLTGLVFISCDLDGGTSVNAKPPLISAQPQGGTWDVSGADAFTLTVTAKVSGGGVIGYQWYANTAASNSGGSVMNGQTGATLTLAKADYAENKDYYFYVVVTNTNNNRVVRKPSVSEQLPLKNAFLEAESRENARTCRTFSPRQPTGLSNKSNVSGNKTATATSNFATVTVTGNATATNPEAAYTAAPIPENLKGAWVSERGEVFIICEQTVTSKYGDDVTYEGTIAGHRSNDSGDGYITVQYTTAYDPGNVGNFYVIHYKDLTATTVSLAGAGNESDLGDGKASQTAAEAAYTVTGGYFAWYSDFEKDGG